MNTPGRMPEQLVRYWTSDPEVLAKVRYGTPGQFDRLCKMLTEATKGRLHPEAIRGIAARLIHRVTGRWPGDH